MSSFSDWTQAATSALGVGLGLRDEHLQTKQTKTANALTEAAQRRTIDQADTAHQREVADLQAAGLNPVLSGLGGSGLSTGSGASGFQVQPRNLASRMASSAQSAALVAQAIKAKADGQISAAQARVARGIAAAQLDTAISSAQVARNNARVSGVDADITDSPYGRFIEGARRLTGIATPWINSLRGAYGSSARGMSEVPRVNVSRLPARDYISEKRSDDEGGEA